MKNIINLTPHTITDTTTGKSFPPSGRVARAKQSTTKVATVGGVPVFTSNFEEIEGLPAPMKNTVYLVSSLTLNAVKGRFDVVAPGNVQRDEHGKIVGCCGFRR